MKEKILELKVDTTQVLKENVDAVYLTEHDADQILSLIREEIKKVENHYNKYHKDEHQKLCLQAFENCRQKILTLLREV